VCWRRERIDLLPVAKDVSLTSSVMWRNVQDMTVPLSEHTVMRGQLVLLGAERVLSLFASLFGLSSYRNSVDMSLQMFFLTFFLTQE
jgi:hypothetical protein